MSGMQISNTNARAECWHGFSSIRNRARCHMAAHDNRRVKHINIKFSVMHATAGPVGSILIRDKVARKYRWHDNTYCPKE